MGVMRTAAIQRDTKETRIVGALKIEGRGKYDISTGIRFFDHMLELFTKHGGFDLKLHAKGDLPFETEGTAVATPEGHIRIHTRKVTVAQVSVKGLMDLLGLKSAQLINTDKVRGVRLEGNDLILDPALLLPPLSPGGSIESGP